MVWRLPSGCLPWTGWAQGCQVGGGGQGGLALGEEIMAQQKQVSTDQPYMLSCAVLWCAVCCGPCACTTPPAHFLPFAPPFHTRPHIPHHLPPLPPPGRPPFAAESRQQAEDFFLDSLNTWRQAQGLSSFVLMGHSLGGYLAASYALRHPEQVDHLVLVCPAGVVSVWGFDR
jgi:pimeloyl-ACP methyl ester carboxylesterase